MPTQVQCLQPVLYRNTTDLFLSCSKDKTVTWIAPSQRRLALSSPRMQVERVSHAASLSQRIVRGSLLKKSKKRYFCVGQSQSRILHHWGDGCAGSVHVLCFHSASEYMLCLCTMPEDGWGRRS